MPDLFDIPVIPGLAERADVVDPGEETALVAAIGAFDLSPFRFHQWTGKRRTQSFGWSHDFQSGMLVPGPPLPEWLAAVRDRTVRAFGLDPSAFVEALIIRYDPGAGIGWHRDRPDYADIIGLSLGSPAVMRFRRRNGCAFRRATLTLAPRGAYRLSGAARHDWEHSIAAADSGTRWSLTFRSLSAAGRARARAGPDPVNANADADVSGSR